LTAAQVLRDVVRGQSSGPSQDSFEAMWGAGAGPQFASLHPRSKSTSLSAVRAANRALVLTPPGAECLAAIAYTGGINAAVDAWLAGMVQVATRAAPRPADWTERLRSLKLDPEARPISIGGDVGALCEHLRRMHGDWDFPLTRAAREASGCGDSPDRSGKIPCFPSSVAEFLDSPGGFLLSPLRRAALAIGGDGGLGCR
jgi:hypothetical protein